MSDAHKKVDCKELVNLLGDYVDDTLPDADKQAVDGHMHQCAPCMAFLKQYRFAPSAVRQTLLKEVPTDLESRLLTFLKGRCKK
jgi:anti-sigma factor RsiW